MHDGWEPFTLDSVRPVQGFDADLARLALKEIENRPQEWDQSNWHCGTSMCFAGFVAELAGAKWISPQSRSALDAATYLVLTPDGKIEQVSNFAAKALGFVGYDSSRNLDLFHACNDLEDLRGMIDAWEEWDRSNGSNCE